MTSYKFTIIANNRNKKLADLDLKSHKNDPKINQVQKSPHSTFKLIEFYALLENSNRPWSTRKVTMYWMVQGRMNKIPNLLNRMNKARHKHNL